MDKKESLVKKLKNELYESDSYIEELNLKMKNEISSSNNLRKELNILLTKNNSLSEYISEMEQKISDDISKYKTEISDLNIKIESKSIINKENEEKYKNIFQEYEKYKTDLNLMNIKIINYQKEIEDKNSIINELEKNNIKLSANITEILDIKKMHFFDNNSSNLNLADELKKNEDLEYLNKENIFLSELKLFAVTPTFSPCSFCAVTMVTPVAKLPNARLNCIGSILISSIDFNEFIILS